MRNFQSYSRKRLRFNILSPKEVAEKLFNHDNPSITIYGGWEMNKSKLLKKLDNMDSWYVDCTDESYKRDIIGSLTIKVNPREDDQKYMIYFIRKEIMRDYMENPDSELLDQILESQRRYIFID